MKTVSVNERNLTVTAFPKFIEGHNRKLLKCFMLLGLILSVYMLTLQPVMAHGEKNLEPFIRMRSIQWYDVQWSKQELKVNDEVVITGKFHVAEDWPISVPKPEATFLSVATPGPVLIRTERYLNGKPWVNSAALQLGGDYDFKIVLKGRLPGRYHIHPFFSLKDAGQVMGPGAWLEVTGNSADFSNELKTINGELINMETYGLSNGIFWHTFWGALATAWLLWWLRRPLFIPRYRMLEAGMEDELVTQQDKRIAKVILVGIPVFVLVAYTMTANQYPKAIPFQAGLDQIAPLPAQVNTGAVSVETLKAQYNVPQRALTMTVTISNQTEKPIEAVEFTTANVRFLNPKKARPNQDDKNPLVAAESLSLDNPTPIQPGEVRNMTITAQDALWESQKLDGLIRDADSRIGGLLFFNDTEGKRHIASVSSAIIPEFN